MKLHELLGEVTGALDRADIPHMVAGSVASTFWSEPRTTQDIDIIIDPTPESLRAFVDSLDRQRWYVGDAEAALSRRDMVNVIDVTSGWKVDLIMCRDREFSRAELARRRSVDIEGQRVFLARAEDTILAKLEWRAAGGSDRQLDDVVAIVAAQGEALDLDHLRHWAGELGVRDQLERVLANGP